MDEIEWIRQATLKAYPNPDRIGCPAPELLEAMARRTVAMSAEEHDHIFHCSPCFSGYLNIRSQIRRRRVVRLNAIWAVSTLLVAALIFWAYSGLYPSPAPRQFATAFNLGERPVFRGAHPVAVDPSPFVLPRGIVRLSLTLPVGSEPGIYQLQICRNGQTHPLVTASGSAAVGADGSTVLTVELNSAKLRTGPYALGIRQDNADWSYSPLLVRDPTGG